MALLVSTPVGEPGATLRGNTRRLMWNEKLEWWAMMHAQVLPQAQHLIYSSGWETLTLFPPPFSPFFLPLCFSPYLTTTPPLLLQPRGTYSPSSPHPLGEKGKKKERKEELRLDVWCLSVCVSVCLSVFKLGFSKFLGLAEIEGQRGRQTDRQTDRETER